MDHLARIFTAGALVKALVYVPLAVAGASSPLWALVLVVVSACLTGAWGLLNTLVVARENRRVHERLDTIEQRQKDMAGAVGVGKRREDDSTSHTE